MRATQLKSGDAIEDLQTNCFSGIESCHLGGPHLRAMTHE